MTTDSSTELKPCPFCGNDQPIIEKYSIAGVGERYRVVCGQSGCGAEVSAGYWVHPNMAVRAWNRRVDFHADGQRESAQECKRSDSQADSLAESQCESAQECKCQRWISVKDKLPENEEYVLCCTLAKNGTQNIIKGYYSGGMWRVGMNSNVTHWMPLPKLPKEGEDDA